MCRRKLETPYEGQMLDETHEIKPPPSSKQMQSEKQISGETNGKGEERRNERGGKEEWARNRVKKESFLDQEENNRVCASLLSCYEVGENPRKNPNKKKLKNLRGSVRGQKESKGSFAAPFFFSLHVRGEICKKK